MDLREIEAALARFKTCPKCASEEGFWLGLRSNRVCVQCKGCGAEFGLHEVYPIADANKRSVQRKLFRR